MKDISQNNLIDLLTDRLEFLDNQLDFETVQIADFRIMYDDFDYPVDDDLIEIDTRIIGKAGYLSDYIYDEGNYDDEMKNHWAWNPGLIAAGEFPVEKIPEHVRELARNLYYK